MHRTRPGARRLRASPGPPFSARIDRRPWLNVTAHIIEFEPRGSAHKAPYSFVYVCYQAFEPSAQGARQRSGNSRVATSHLCLSYIHIALAVSSKSFAARK